MDTPVTDILAYINGSKSYWEGWGDTDLDWEAHPTQPNAMVCVVAEVVVDGKDMALVTMFDNNVDPDNEDPLHNILPMWEHVNRTTCDNI